MQTNLLLLVMLAGFPVRMRIVHLPALIGPAHSVFHLQLYSWYTNELNAAGFAAFPNTLKCHVRRKDVNTFANVILQRTSWGRGGRPHEEEAYVDCKRLSSHLLEHVGDR